MNIVSVSSSEGGFNKPSAALMEGMAAMAKPVVVARMAIAVKPRARFQKGFPTGGLGAKVAVSMVSNWFLASRVTDLQQIST